MTVAAQVRWQKPAYGSEAKAIAQIRWHRTADRCPVSIDPSHGQVAACGGSDGERRDRAACLTGCEPFHLVTVLVPRPVGFARSRRGRWGGGRRLCVTGPAPGHGLVMSWCGLTAKVALSVAGAPSMEPGKKRQLTHVIVQVAAGGQHRELASAVGVPERHPAIVGGGTRAVDHGAAAGGSIRPPT